MADIQKLNVNSTIYDISVPWSKVTGKPSTFAPSSHTHTYIKDKDNYSFTSSNLPTSFDQGISCGFVQADSVFPSYGSVLTVRTYSGGGGSLQLYAPYSNTYGGSRLRARFGNYDSNSGNSWTTLKEIAWLSDIPTSLPANGGTSTYASRLGDSSAYYTKASLDTALNGKANSSHGTHLLGAAALYSNSSQGSNCNDVTSNLIGYYTSNGPSTSLGATSTDGTLYSQAYSSSWVTQIAQDYRNGNLFTRGKNNGTWTAWKAVSYSDTNTWRPVTNTYTGSDQSTCVSQYGTNALYNALVNGHANTATDSSKLGGYSADTYFAYRGWDNNPGKDANTAMTTVMGSNFSYSNNCPNTGPLLTFNCGGYNLQINGGYNSNSGKDLSFRLRNGDNSTNHSWYNFIHSGNIGSQSVNYATSAGSASSVAWSGITGKPSTFTPSSHTHDYLNPARFNTTGSHSYYKININSYTSWMLAFNVRIYRSYSYFDIRFSGYNYGTSKWYSPVATLTDGDDSITVYFGYDADWKLWVAVPGGNYTGIEITNVTNGYTSHGYGDDISGLFTITGMSSLSGTIQSTQTIQPPSRAGHTHSQYLTELPSHTHSYLPLGGGTLTGLLSINTNGTTATYGAQNSSWVHFENTAGLNYYFSNSIHVNGDIKVYNKSWGITSGGRFDGSGFYQSSDERLKIFYDPIKVDLEKLKKLRKNYFKFNDKDELEIGVSAQEIQQLYPEIITENDEGYLSVAYDKLSVIALSAIDELDDINTKQQEEINNLNTKINDLEDQLSTIKNILKEKGIL